MAFSHFLDLNVKKRPMVLSKLSIYIKTVKFDNNCYVLKKAA